MAGRVFVGGCAITTPNDGKNVCSNSNTVPYFTLDLLGIMPFIRTRSELGTLFNEELNMNKLSRDLSQARRRIMKMLRRFDWIQTLTVLIKLAQLTRLILRIYCFYEF